MANKTKDVKSRPAGIDDNFEIVGMNINHIVENKKYVLKAKGKRVQSLLSTELEEGMSIKAYDGGKKVEEEIQH